MWRTYAGRESGPEKVFAQGDGAGGAARLDRRAGAAGGLPTRLAGETQQAASGLCAECPVDVLMRCCCQSWSCGAERWSEERPAVAESQDARKTGRDGAQSAGRRGRAWVCSLRGGRATPGLEAVGEQAVAQSPASAEFAHQRRAAGGVGALAGAQSSPCATTPRMGACQRVVRQKRR